MRRAARLLQGSLKQLNRSWPEIETKLSFQQTPVRTQLQGPPGQQYLVPNPAHFNTASGSAAGTSGFGRQAGGQSRLALLTKTLQQPPRSPGAVLAVRPPRATKPLSLRLPSVLDMQGTEALAGRLCLQPVPQWEHLHGQHTQTSSRDCTPSRWESNSCSFLELSALPAHDCRRARLRCPGWLYVQLPVHSLQHTALSQGLELPCVPHPPALHCAAC